MYSSKKMSFYYLMVSFIGGLVGFSFSMSMSLELSFPFCLMEEEYFFICVTSHGFMMIFFFMTMMSSVFSNFFMPSFCYLKCMFLESDLISFYFIIISFFLLSFSLVLGKGVGVGWTVYTPLSLTKYTFSFSLEMVLFSVYFFGFNSLLSSINLLSTCYFNLYKIESFFDMSPFCLSYFFTGGLVILATPSLISVFTMLFLDSVLVTCFFSFEYGGDPVLFQIVFWIFGHPEVYILILPVFGLVSLMLEDYSFGFIFNKMGIIFSMFSLVILSFVVFGHHMVTVGYSLDFSGFFMTSTMIISVPTGVKIFSWIFVLFMYGGKFSLVMGFLVSFLFLFSFGGLSGVFLSNTSLDLIFHDTYFVVGHFHMVLGLASIFGFLSGTVYFMSFFNLLIILEFYFFNLFFSMIFLFGPFHMLGLFGFPSSMMSYSLEYFMYNYVSSLSFLNLIFLIFLVVVILFFML